MYRRFDTYQAPLRLIVLSLICIFPLIAVADSTTSAGHQLADGLVSLELPGKTWELTQEGTTSPDIAIIKMTDGSARGNLALQAVPGVSFEQLVPALEGAMASKYENFEKLSAATTNVEERPVFRIECSFKDDEGDWKAIGLFTKTSGDQLFSLTFRARPDELPKLSDQIDQFVASIEVDGHHLVASKTN